MPVGLTAPSDLLPVRGIRLATATSNGARDNVALLVCDPGTAVAAAFTCNRFCAAPVQLARRHLAAAEPRALVINAGNANAGTGQGGYEDARAVCAAVAQALAIDEEAVLPFSTGVVGERMPVAKVAEAARRCAGKLTEDDWQAAAAAIMTTDTLPKGASRTSRIGSDTVTLTGIVKGAGMIRPDMATMLAFIATDARVETPLLQAALQRAVAGSFNRITVDGDTSTNDACVVLATGRAGQTGITAGSAALEEFHRALDELLLELAQAVVRDAEGATKFVEIAVTGAVTDADAGEVAFTVAHSPLVKTALFASDANWGRILAAVGRAPVARLEVDKVSLTLNQVRVLTHGQPDPAYSEAAGQAAMAAAEVRIGIDLGLGSGAARVWTSDLSHEYVRINAEYRT